MNFLLADCLLVSLYRSFDEPVAKTIINTMRSYKDGKISSEQLKTVLVLVVGDDVEDRIKSAVDNARALESLTRQKMSTTPDNVCVLCRKCPPTHIFENCGHMCVCASCSVKRCPICYFKRVDECVL